jgi:hypothetical protein
LAVANQMSHQEARMKKQGLRVAGIAMATGLLSLVVATHTAVAQQANFPRLARGFSSWLARAMDQCAAPTLSVVNPSGAGVACPQANSVTDSTLSMRFAKMRVTARGRVGLFATGFTLGDALRIRLTLRVTQIAGQVKHPPGSNKRVTFPDLTIDCPKAPDAFLARPNGAVVGRTDFGACLAPSSNLQNGNIEILDAELINVNNGKTVAIPGVLR